MTIPLSKYYELEDYEELAEELNVVDQDFAKDSPQSPHRRWEYALAIRALDTWLETRRGRGTTGKVVDVGGAGSPFWRMIGESTIVVDPHENDTIAEYLDKAPSLAQAVFCLSVLEHVEDLDPFLYHLSCLTAPGGLLFLTFDACACTDHLPEEDPHHFRWMRKRIFTPECRGWLVEQLCEKYHFAPLGQIDYAPKPVQVYDYSFASLALIKRS